MQWHYTAFNLNAHAQPPATRYTTSMTTRHFRDDGEAEQDLLCFIRRMLLHCYYQDDVPLEELTDERVAADFAHNAHFRQHLDLIGIHPDTLFGFNDEGKWWIRFFANSWVKQNREPLPEIG